MLNLSSGHFARLLCLADLGYFRSFLPMSTSNTTTFAEAFGLYLKSARTALGMSLREVEDASDKQISNAYLSQLENGKIAKPSPHILHALSEIYQISYETIMERAGYLPPSVESDEKAADFAGPQKHGKLATRAIENLTAEEEKALRVYLNLYRKENPREKTKR